MLRREWCRWSGATTVARPIAFFVGLVFQRLLHMQPELPLGHLPLQPRVVLSAPARFAFAVALTFARQRLRLDGLVGIFVRAVFRVTVAGDTCADRASSLVGPGGELVRHIGSGSGHRQHGQGKCSNWSVRRIEDPKAGHPLLGRIDHGKTEHLGVKAATCLRVKDYKRLGLTHTVPMQGSLNICTRLEIRF